MARFNRILLTGVVFSALSVPALSHSSKEATIPEDGAVVATVDTLQMTFDAPMRITAISLSSDAGDVPLTREADMDPVTTFRATPSAELSDGTYEVEWRGLSADGHPMRGVFRFTVSAPD
ncbi:MAG: copper resistance CopC family protein [Pseudomonadota bacterium]